MLCDAMHELTLRKLFFLSDFHFLSCANDGFSDQFFQYYLDKPFNANIAITLYLI